MNDDSDGFFWMIRLGLVFLVVVAAMFGLSRCSLADEAQPPAPTTREFTLKDGTRCVAIGDKALVCDFSKPVY